MADDNTIKIPIYKKWWFWAIIAVVVLAGIGSSANTSRNDTTSTIPEQAEPKPEEKSDEQSSQSEKTTSDNTQEERVTSGQLQGAIMIDAFAKWDDVDETSVHIDENSDGQFVVNISTNYNGSPSELEDTLIVYCNKVASVVELKDPTVSSLEISWVVPEQSAEVAGMCHYHNNGGALVYDQESTGILQYR